MGCQKNALLVLFTVFNYQLELEDVGYAEETTRKLRIKHRYGDPT